MLAGQHEQVYENMSHFTPELKGKNKNIYFGTRKMKPVFGIMTKNCSVNLEGQLVMVNHVTYCFIRTITLAFKDSTITTMMCMNDIFKNIYVIIFSHYSNESFCSKMRMGRACP